MKNKIFIKAMAFAMACAMTFTLTPIKAMAETAEVASDITSVERTIVKNCFTADLNSKGTSIDFTLSRTMMQAPETETVDITWEPMYVTDIAPVIPGYLVCHATYSSVKEGWTLAKSGAATNAKYMQLLSIYNKTTKLYAVNPKMYTGSKPTANNMLAQNTANINYYYAPIDYTVQYLVDDAVVAVDENTYSIEGTTQVPVTDMVPEKEGYVFTGWTLQETGATYQTGDTIKLDDVYEATSVSTSDDLRASTNPGAERTLNLVAQFEEAPAALSISADVTNAWGEYVQADITVTNDSDNTMKSWKAQVPVNAEITQIWNAKLVEENDGVATFACPDWQQNLAAGESYTFGIIAKLTEDELTIGDVKLISKEAETDEASYEVAFDKNSQWAGGYIGQISIANTGDADITNWTIEFDLDDEITSIWNGTVVSHEGSHYVIENAGYNSTVAAKTSTSFGFAATPADGEYSEAGLSNVVVKAIQ